MDIFIAANRGNEVNVKISLIFNDEFAGNDPKLRPAFVEFKVLNLKANAFELVS